MKPSKSKPARVARVPDALVLPAVFPESQVPAQPITVDFSAPLPSPDSLIEIPMPVRDRPPRVLIADDESAFCEGLKRSLDAIYPGALDLRFWMPGGPVDLVQTVRNYLKEGWRPDAVVIDINFDDGGKHGVDYLKDLRDEPGCADLAVVLASGNQLRDLDEGRLTQGQGVNRTRDEPAQWLQKAKPLEPEAILYGKTGDAKLLGRIGEHIDEWRRAARRRGWIRLLQEVAQSLDHKGIKVEKVAEKIVEFAVNDLRIDAAFVRQISRDGGYQLVAVCPPETYVRKGTKLTVTEVPILAEIVDHSREPVLREGLTAEESGRFKDAIAGQAFLGVGCVLGNRSVGFITLLRRPGTEPFDKEVDGRHISILARLLASAMRVATLRDRQTQLLRFADQASTASDRKTVCERLAATLNEEIHQTDDSDAKVTVRLLDSGTGNLKRFGIKGFTAPDQKIHLTTTGSIYAEVVRSNTFQRIKDCRTHRGLLQPAGGIEIRSELCVPLSIGKYAIGAVNLEHRHEDFYREYDEEFVQAAASLAANAIERIRTARLLEGMTDFVHRFASDETEALNQRLRDLLYEFCGYSVLVDLASVNGSDSPWQVNHVECRFEASDPEKLRHEMTDAYSSEWAETWVGRLYINRAWQEEWAAFTAEEADFRRINLTPLADDPTFQKADAVLWLRGAEDAAPHRALLLMWGLPPPMNEANVKLLGNMARLFSELDTRKLHIAGLVKQNLIGEQAAQIGHVMQHFRHRLGNLTGGQENHIDSLEAAFRHGDETGFKQAISSLRKNAANIANAFHRSKGYVKVPEMRRVLIQQVIDKAVQDLQARLGGVELTRDVTPELKVVTDPEIAALVLYSVLENALDATADQPQPVIRIQAETRGQRVALRVADNGKGIPESILPRLFEWGMTSKTQGLGSALAFARTRMRQLDGDLVFPTPQPTTGATFELLFAYSRPEETAP